MTKHRTEYFQRVIPTESEALIAFVEASGFIYATKRTKPLLDVLAKTGLLIRRMHTVKHDDGTRVKLERYTLKGKVS